MLFTFVPAAVIPLALMFGKHHLIDLPSQTVSLEYSIEKRSVDSVDHHFIVISNVGEKRVEEKEGYLKVRFTGPIESMPNQDNYTPGTSPMNKAGTEPGSCGGRTKCKVMLGLLAAGGTLVVQFNTRHSLNLFPEINHGGNRVNQPCWCEGLRPELRQLCPSTNVCRITNWR